MGALPYAHVEWIGSVMDITKRKPAQGALRARELNLRLILASIPAPVALMTPSGQVESVNQPVLEYFGKTFEELKRWGTSDAVHPDDLSHAIAVWKEAIETGQPYDVKERLRRFDGVYRWFGVRGFPLRDPEGRILNWCVLLTDIDDRERAEEALRVVIETADDAVVSADESGAIQFANPATIRVFGYDPAELIGKPLTVLMPEFMRKLHENGFRRYLTTGQRHVNWQSNEFTGLRKNGQEFPVEVSFGELTMNGHRVFTGFIRDISERKQAEEQREKLRRAQADLAHINRVTTMGELAGSLGHEIKQPISAAAADAETCLQWLARDQPDLAEAQAAASRLIKDVTRASDIISRIGSLFKKDVPQRKLVQIDQLIDEMVSLIRSEAVRYSISIHSELAKGLPKIMADRVGLQQVFMNLMLNGIDAMKDMGTPGRLTITARQSENRQLIVSVSDTGVGLQPEQNDQIFSVFFTSKPQGTGMGLPISRSIIESHGGRLWATSGNGPGATFQFTLPIEDGEH